jgi:hypothetical protein
LNFNGKSIRQEKNRVKEKNRGDKKMKKEEAETMSACSL